MNNDFIFASFILRNWQNAKNAKELAEIAAYSEAAFNKKFKKVFGTTPYKWLNEKRATQILYTITNTDKPLKQIADEYNLAHNNNLITIVSVISNKPQEISEHNNHSLFRNI